jgi:cold shock CspA family protein
LSTDAVRGRVEEFDAAVGLGWVVDDQGRRLQFHCTQIADGSRSIAPRTEVTFEIVPGHLGHWEAAAITAVSS